MKLPRRKFLYLAASAVPLSSISRIARAQTYPARPVRVIVPYAPGGPTDVFGRLMAQKLSEQLGKQFYVENMGGGGNVFPVPVQLPVQKAADQASTATTLSDLARAGSCAADADRLLRCLRCKGVCAGDHATATYPIL